MSEIYAFQCKVVMDEAHKPKTDKATTAQSKIATRLPPAVEADQRGECSHAADRNLDVEETNVEDFVQSSMKSECSKLPLFLLWQ